MDTRRLQEEIESELNGLRLSYRKIIESSTIHVRNIPERELLTLHTEAKSIVSGTCCGHQGIHGIEFGIHGLHRLRRLGIYYRSSRHCVSSA